MLAFVLRKKLLPCFIALILALITCLDARAQGGTFYYAGGKKHFLEPTADWVAVEVENDTAAHRVDADLKARGAINSKRKSMHHDRYNILVLPLDENAAPAKRLQQKEEIKKMKGVRREVRVFKNGNLAPKVETDDFVIQFENAIPRQEIEKLLAQHHARIIRPLGSFAPNGFVAQVDSSKTSSFDAANALHGKAGVLFSHPDFIWPKAQRYVPNDTLYRAQWHLNNDGTNGDLPGADIKAERAWEITRGNSSLVIAIIDDGVDLDHEDFQASGKLVGHWDFVGNDGDPRPDANGHHGTACAGLAAAVGNNSLGVSGVAPNCRLMGVRLLGPNQTPSMEAAAISHAKNNGADIISNSWGPQDGLGVSQPCPDVVNSAINDAVTTGRGGKGCVIVWAAGNGNESVDLDGYASHPQVICVAATESTDTKSSYSDFGNAIDVAAPGGTINGDMVTTDRMGSVGYSSGNYAFDFNGTSAATPVVSGVAALILSVEPNLSWSQVRQRLRNTADFIDTANVTYDSNGHHPWYGYGRVNAMLAVGASDTTAPTVTIDSPVQDGNYTTFNTASGSCSDSGFGVWRVRVALSDSGGRWWHWEDNSWGSTTFSFLAHGKLVTTSGSAWSALIPTLPAGTYQVHAQSIDKSDNSSGWSSKTFVIDQGPPTITFSPIQNGSVIFNFNQLGGTISEPGTLKFLIMDLSGGLEGLRYWNGSSWITDGNDPSVWIPAIVNGTQWSANTALLPSRSQIRLGDYGISARAVDLAGNTGQGGISVTRSETDSTLPVVSVTSPANDAVLTNNVLTTISGTAHDPESGIASVSVYLLRFINTDPYYWNGSSWTTTPATLDTTFNQNTGVWQTIGSLPGGIHLPNETYQIQVTAMNGESPGGTKGIGTEFHVDYHPVFVWNGNINSLWDVAANWTPNIVPPTNAIVVINNGTCDNRHLGSVQMHGVNLTGGTLLTSGMFIKKLNMSGGSLEGGAVNVDGDKGVFKWDAGSIRGVFGILPGATVTATNANPKTLGSGVVLNNYGTIDWAGGAFYNYAYYNDQIATINNHSNAVFNLLGDGNLIDTDYNFLKFNNERGGLFAKKSGAGSTYVHETSFINLGEMRVESGKLHFHTLFLENGNRITGNGEVKTSSGRIEARGETLVDNSTFLIENGTFHGEPNSLLSTTNGGVFEWVTGTLSGTVEISPNSSLYLTSNNSKSFNSGAVLKNRGYVLWFDNGAIYNYAYELYQRATIENYGTFAMFGDGSANYDYNPPFFINREEGLIAKVGGTNANNLNWSFHNDGELNTTTGIVSLNSGGTSSGLFKADDGSAIQFQGGTHTLQNGTIFSGDGIIRLSGGTLTRAGTVYSDEANPATMEITAGTFTGDGSLEGPFTVNWVNGTLSGTLNLGADVILNCNSANTKQLYAAVINNSGTFNWNGGGAIYSYAYYAYERTTFNNLQSGVFRMNDDGNVFDIAHSASFFTNHPGGIIVKADGWGTTSLDDYELHNAGEIRVNTGTLRSGSKLYLNPGTAFEGELGLFSFAGETVVSTPLLSSLNLRLEAGTFIGATTSEGEQMASYAGTAPLDWEGGTITGTFGVETGSVINVVGPNTKNFGSGSRFNNKGAVNWHSGKLYNSAYNSWDRTIFNNLENGSFNLFGDGQVFDSSYNRSYFTNHPGAVIAKFGGEGTNVLNHFGIENFGEIYLSQGSLQFTDLLNLYDGSIIFGDGNVYWQGNVNLNGSVFVYCDVELGSGSLTGAKSPMGFPLGSYMGTGTLKWINGSVGGSIMIQPGSTWELSGNNQKYLGTSAVIENFGTMVWKGPGRIYNSAYYIADRATLNNYGLFLLENDGLAFDYSYNRSLFNNQPGGRLVKSGTVGTSLLSSFAFRNSGEIEAVSGTIQFVEHLEIDSGSSFKGDVGQTAGDTWLHGTTFINSGTFTLAGGNFHGGHATNNAAIATAPGASFAWTGGTIGGTLAITPGATVNLSGTTKTLGSGAALNNHGNVRWTSGTVFNSAYYADQPATINNRSGALWDITADVSFSHDYNPSTFNNDSGATLRKSGGTGTSSSSWVINQNGTLDLQSGKLLAANALNLGGSGTTALRIGGTVPLTEHAQLERAGDVTFGGTLKLSLHNSFSPTNNTVFNIVSYTSRTGEFATVDLPVLPKESKWKLTYGPNALTAEVVAVTSIQSPTKLENGTFQFTVSGAPASAAILEGSVDLETWIPVMTNSPFTGELNFSDPSAAGSTNKFYRVVIIE